MAPFAGRLHQARLEWAGQVHALPAHAAPHAIHGTAVDAGWSVRESSPTSAVLEHELADPWPFRGRVRQELSLFHDRLETTLVVEADDEMPVVVGWHPWFRRRLARGAEVELDLTAEQMYEKGEDALPTGRLVPPPPGPYDDCFLGLASSPRLTWPGALELVLDSPTDHWVVFTERPEAVCVEPQTGPPDAVRLGRAATVPAGGTHELRLVLRWQRLADDPVVGSPTWMRACWDGPVDRCRWWGWAAGSSGPTGARSARTTRWRCCAPRSTRA